MSISLLPMALLGFSRIFANQWNVPREVSVCIDEQGYFSLP